MGRRAVQGGAVPGLDQDQNAARAARSGGAVGEGERLRICARFSRTRARSARFTDGGMVEGIGAVGVCVWHRFAYETIPVVRLTPPPPKSYRLRYPWK